MKKMSISVVLATHNEEINLPDCLKSVKDLADEIIVVDGRSTDRTVEMAKTFNAKVYVVPNQKNFHINKQKAIDKATKDWILQLDADERVTPELAAEITKKINDSESVNGYWIPRKNWFLGRYLMKGGVYPDYTLRLYKKNKGKLPQKDVHEQAVVEGEVGFLKSPLIHFADPSFSRYINRFDRYTTFIAGQLHEQKTRQNPLNLLKYLVALPLYWFVLQYGRHKGFMDGWQGFVFAFFSALRFPVSYIKYIKKI